MMIICTALCKIAYRTLNGIVRAELGAYNWFVSVPFTPFRYIALSLVLMQPREAFSPILLFTQRLIGASISVIWYSDTPTKASSLAPEQRDTQIVKYGTQIIRNNGTEMSSSVSTRALTAQTCIGNLKYRFDLPSTCFSLSFASYQSPTFFANLPYPDRY